MCVYFCTFVCLCVHVCAVGGVRRCVFDVVCLFFAASCGWLGGRLVVRVVAWAVGRLVGSAAVGVVVGHCSLL